MSKSSTQKNKTHEELKDKVTFPDYLEYKPTLPEWSTETSPKPTYDLPHYQQIARFSMSSEDSKQSEPGKPTIKFDLLKNSPMINNVLSG